MSKQMTINGFSRQVIELELREAIVKQEPDKEVTYGVKRCFSIDGFKCYYAYTNRSWQVFPATAEIHIELHDDGTNEIKLKGCMEDYDSPADFDLDPELKDIFLWCEDIVANREAIIEILKKFDIEPYDPTEQPDTRLKYRNKSKLST